jgi:hypothetical protein
MTGIISGDVTMLPSARNPEVQPQEGNWDASYDYSVEVIFDTEIELELWVWDPWFSDWTNQGTAHYSATRTWELIYWNATKPFSEECVGSVSKFKFKYAGVDIKERRDGRLVPLVSAGPRIQTTPPQVEFTNGKVSRDEATYLDELNYSVNVEASKVMDIELKVYDPCFGMWKSIDIRTAGTGDGKELTWENERPFFDTNCKKGSSKFLFNAYYRGELINKSEVCPGPDLIPLIEYKNPKVEPGDGRYNWRFNYSVEIANVTEHVNPEQIKLEVLNPHTLARKTFNQTGRENDTLLWRVEPFIDDPDCRGTAKYYFVYGDDRWPDVPCYGPEITPPPPAPVELEGAVESTTTERGDLNIEYYVHTGYVTPFNFTASSNSEVDLELLIRDPVAGGLERKGDLQHCRAGETVTWKYIEPFDSIKEDKIKDYIGQSFDFTFMYGGEVYPEEFRGPELIVAFRNPECPTEVIYGDMFEYRIDMIANEELNVTLQYYNGSAWNSVGAEAYTGVKVWDTLTWNCTATEQWKDVRFKWWEDGGGTLMGVLQLDTGMRERYVPQMVN